MYYFSAWERLGYKQPPLCEFWTPISPKLIEVGIEIWYAGGTTSNYGSNGRPAYDCEVLIM